MKYNNLSEDDWRNIKICTKEMEITLKVKIKSLHFTLSKAMRIFLANWLTMGGLRYCQMNDLDSLDNDLFRQLLPAKFYTNELCTTNYPGTALCKFRVL